MSEHNEEWEYWLIEQHDDKWEELHAPKSGIISASIVPDIVGFGYKSRMKRWEICTGLAMNLDDNFHMQRGQLLEPKAIQRFYQKYPRFSPIGQPGPKKSKDFPWLHASLDHVFIDRVTKEFMLLEIKCPVTVPPASDEEDKLDPYSYQAHLEEEIKNEKIKVKYLIQMQIQMYCMGPTMQKGILYLYTTKEQHAIVVPRDDEIINVLLTFIFIFQSQVMKNEKPQGACYKDFKLVHLLKILYNKLVFL